MTGKKIGICAIVPAVCAGCGVFFSPQPLSLCGSNCDIVFSGKHLFA